MEKLLPLEKTRLLSVPMSDPDRGRKALPSAGPHVLSMVIGLSAASGGGGWSVARPQRLQASAESSLHTWSSATTFSTRANGLNVVCGIRPVDWFT